MDDEVEDILNKLAAKRKEYESITKPCCICGKNTNQWVPILPANGEPDGLGFGMPAEGKTRLAWAAVCAEHDVSDPKIEKRIIDTLTLKRMILTN